MAETTLKNLLDRIRSRPEWQHPDPAVRAAAVLALPASGHELVLALAREDADARVRRAAVKRLAELPVLAEIAGSDAEEQVREEAAARIAQLLLHEQDDEQALRALPALSEPRLLAGVARGAALATLREAAVRALTDARALASVVREADDAKTRHAALDRIEDDATLLGLAQNLEHKALAVAAVERLSDPEALRAVAGKARVPAAARRARARLETGEPAVAPTVAAAEVPATADAEAERRAYEEARAALEREVVAAREREAAARAEREARAHGEQEQALAARREALTALVEQAEALAQGDLPQARSALRELGARIRGSSAGEGIADLRERFAAAAAALEARAESQQKERAQAEQARRQALTALAERAEALVGQGAEASLRDTDHALREIKEALTGGVKPTARRARDPLHARLEAARRQLYPLLQQLREDAEWKRWANASAQEELIAHAESLVAETNLERAAGRLQELERRWRQAAEAPRDQSEALWTRFKAAREQVKAKVDVFLDEQAAQQAQNLAQKEALVERAEALAESSDWVKTAEALRALQAEWKAIGPVPRAVSQRLWERFRKPCDRFFTRFATAREERGREWEDNLAKKVALCEQAETLAESTAWEEAAAGIKRLQAEWKAVGPVKKSRSDAVWHRFRAACDRFFDRYKNRDAHAREIARQAREGICAELEALLPEGEAPPPEPPADLVERVQAAQAAWRQAGGLPHDELLALEERFLRARDRLLELHARAFEGSELDPEQSRRRAEKLVAKVEGLLASLAPKAASEAESATDLAARLRDALASNTIGGREALAERWQAAATELETAQAAWRRLGPLTGDAGRALLARFDEACRRFAQERPRPDPRRAEPQRPERKQREHRERRDRREPRRR